MRIRPPRREHLKKQKTIDPQKDLIPVLSQKTRMSPSEAMQSTFATNVLDTGKAILDHYMDQSMEPVVVFEISKTLHEQFVVIGQKILDHLQLKKAPIDCEKGCAFCCYLMVLALPIEIFNTAQALKSQMSAEEFLPFREKLRTTAKQTGPLTSVERELLKIPCSLLNLETKTCRTYAQRPFSCVGFTSNSKEQCEKLFHAPQTHELMGMFGPIYITANALNTGVFLGLLKRNLDPTPIELNWGLNLIIDDVDGWLKRWLSGEMIFAAYDQTRNHGLADDLIQPLE